MFDERYYFYANIFDPFNGLLLLIFKNLFYYLNSFHYEILIHLFTISVEKRANYYHITSICPDNILTTLANAFNFSCIHNSIIEMHQEQGWILKYLCEVCLVTPCYLWVDWHHFLLQGDIDLFVELVFMELRKIMIYFTYYIHPMNFIFYSKFAFCNKMLPTSKGFYTIYHVICHKT